MADQPKALRLAGYWAAKNDQGEYLYSSLRFREETAAELRRLHAENERLHQINESHEMKLSVRGYEIQIVDLEAVNKELLAALRNIGEYRGEGPSYTTPWQDIVRNLGEIARAAIAKAEGQK